MVFPEDQLTILAYNRVVKDLNGVAEKAFVGSLKFNFELMVMPGFPCKPVEKHCMGMYVGGEWYHLKAWEDIWQDKDVVAQLDVSLLQDKVLAPVLGIKDPRTDQRIRFVGGIISFGSFRKWLTRQEEWRLPCIPPLWRN